MKNGKLYDIVRGAAFNRVTSLAIIICAIILGIETSIEDPEWVTIFVAVDIGITMFFVLEIFIRIIAERNPADFFKLTEIRKNEKRSLIKVEVKYLEEGFWNWFDFLITIISAISIFSHFFEHPEYLLVGRLFRVFRIFRLLEVSEQLKNIEKKIVSIIPTVFSFALLLFILIYIYSIIGFYMFHTIFDETANFTTLFNSMITMFQVMTLEGWGEIMTASLNTHLVNDYVVYAYFISFVGLTAIITLNVFIAVLSSNVEDRMAENIVESRRSVLSAIEAETKHTEEEMDLATSQILKELRSLREEVSKLKGGD